MAVFVSMMRSCWLTHFFRTMGIEVLSGNPEDELVQPDVIFLSDRLAQKIFGGEILLEKC